MTMANNNSSKHTYSFIRPESERYKEYAFAALKARFCDNREKFEDFYDSLDSSIQDDFLDAAAFYLFLVKQGDWHVKTKDYNRNYASINNSLKLVSLFGLIESLFDEKHQDFYQWLCKKNKESPLFPVCDKEALSELYNEYNAVHGATRRCIAFFECLPEDSQKKLLDTIKVKKRSKGYERSRPMKSIKEMVQFLYKLRSEFVHQVSLFNLGGTGAVIIKIDDKTVAISTLDITHLQTFFEEGLVKHFSELNKTREAQA